MCGIAGGVWFGDEQRLDRRLLERMTNVLIHRGPDDQGLFLQSSHGHPPDGPRPGVGLGFRRLSIIDLQGGHQPLANEDGSIQLVFNGEIYNYRELRRRLEETGHRFSTDSDSETIVHLYEELGDDCFSQLNGMFAIAIWDARQQRLVLARDRLGKKPLYYAATASGLFFASELKSLVCLPHLPRTIDHEALDLYFTYQYIPYPKTIYRDISKLAPGTFGFYQHGRWEVKRYWNIDWSKEYQRPMAEVIEEFTELLRDSVRLRLRSDVPLGAFLSGGIDSSLIVALAQSQLKAPIKTFAIGFAEADFDETHYAQQVADYLGTEHRRFEVTADALSILDQLVYHYDEPFSDSSALPTWFLCQQTRQHVTVALSGDGGDELFAGYDRYRALHWSRHLSGLGLSKLLPPAGWWSRSAASNQSRSWMRRLQRFLEALDQPVVARYLQWLQIFGRAERWGMYRQDFIDQLPDRDPLAFLETAWERSGQRDIVTKASLADLQTYLPCDLMTKVDIASMAHSLEARQPFLDYRLVEFASALPLHFKFRRGRGKRLLKDAFATTLPAAIWNRRKMGFGIPLAAWFRGPLRGTTENYLLSTDSRCHRFLKPAAVQALWERHTSGRSNEGYRLWNLLILEAWLRRWEL
jgi:asparagine synthase (glutamine-hydrolysing)